VFPPEIERHFAAVREQWTQGKGTWSALATVLRLSDSKVLVKKYDIKVNPPSGPRACLIRFAAIFFGGLVTSLSPHWHGMRLKH